MFAVTGLDITSITSTGDIDGPFHDGSILEHVTVVQGSTATVNVGYSYSNLAAIDEVYASIPNAHLEGPHNAAPAGANSGTLLLDVSGLAVGSHNLRVQFLNAKQTDTDGNAILVESTMRRLSRESG